MRVLCTGEKDSPILKSVVCVFALVCVYGESVVLLGLPGGAIKPHNTREELELCTVSWQMDPEPSLHMPLRWGIETADGHVPGRCYT